MGGWVGGGRGGGWNEVLWDLYGWVGGWETYRAAVLVMSDIEGFACKELPIFCESGGKTPEEGGGDAL